MEEITVFNELLAPSKKYSTCIFSKGQKIFPGTFCKCEKLYCVMYPLTYFKKKGETASMAVNRAKQSVSYFISLTSLKTKALWTPSYCEYVDSEKTLFVLYDPSEIDEKSMSLESLSSKLKEVHGASFSFNNLFLSALSLSIIRSITILQSQPVVCIANPIFPQSPVITHNAESAGGDRHDDEVDEEEEDDEEDEEEDDASGSEYTYEEYDVEVSEKEVEKIKREELEKQLSRDKEKLSAALEKEKKKLQAEKETQQKLIEKIEHEKELLSQQIEKVKEEQRKSQELSSILPPTFPAFHGSLTSSSIFISSDWCAQCVSSEKDNVTIDPKIAQQMIDDDSWETSHAMPFIGLFHPPLSIPTFSISSASNVPSPFSEFSSSTEDCVAISEIFSSLSSFSFASSGEVNVLSRALSQLQSHGKVGHILHLKRAVEQSLTVFQVEKEHEVLNSVEEEEKQKLEKKKEEKWQAEMGRREEEIKKQEESFRQWEERRKEEEHKKEEERLEEDIVRRENDKQKEA
ncbi:hypothetical protein ADUPG1_011162, partial [Aduncisulcus paluster]